MMGGIDKDGNMNSNMDTVLLSTDWLTKRRRDGEVSDLDYYQPLQTSNKPPIQ
jgi:hypothetical protein